MQTQSTMAAARKRRACIDANVLLEVALLRSQMDRCKRLLKQVEGRAFVSGLSVHLTVYFGVRSLSLEEIRVFLEQFEVVPVSKKVVDWAWANRRNDDFEDALQIASAIYAGCEVFYTLDRTLARDYRHLPQIDVVLVEEGIC